jgi:hypothetical protein
MLTIVQTGVRCNFISSVSTWFGTEHTKMYRKLTICHASASSNDGSRGLILE